MNEYYGAPSTPTSDFLMHYGTRGMKWGIRKQVERKGYRNKSAAYKKAEDKLKKATYAGGIIGGLAYAAKHRDELSNVPKNSSKSRNKSPNKKSNSRISSKEKRALQSFKKSTTRGAIGGALTVGGGLGGGAVGALRYAKKNPNEYRKVKKAFKKMSFKDRMKYVWS